MEVHNNFSPLAFRKKESKATYEKWYAFGKNYAIPASANTLTPFQFTELNIPVFDPNTIEVEVINEETGEAKKSGVYVSFDVMPEHGGVLYVSPGKNSFREALPQGTYRARFSIGDEVYISTPFCVIPGIETSSKYLLIEYWNDEKIAYPGGFITTGANNDFRYQMYVPATICKPKYEFEEELTKRAGYKFLELQTSTKVYAFTFVAPEFICDAMRLIRLSDYIRISHDGEYYNALNFEFDVDWQEQLYLAAVDCQFETDSIIQKLPSFNRRDKASFYNALLANIDTPIMFSPDTVGLYYKEYRETEPVVKGKLIRELSPIDLIDENTTIAVDLGTGEARKFNLYRMLQDYISKSHEDATNFLLHLRGGATFGDDISGSAAHINSAGDARFNDVDADSVSADAVDAGSWLSVGNTAFTVNKSGKTDTGELTARGKAYLTEDVYTGGRTGTITKDGQLKYLSAIIQQFLSSPTFVSGFLGEGFKIWVENGNWHIECDNLTVRQTMNIFELLIQKIRSVNGALVVSQSNGKLSAVEEVGTQYKLTTGEEFPTFQEGDLVRCQTFAGYQGAGLTFDFTQFAKYDYSGGAFDSSLIDVTPDSISFNLNDTGNSGFAFYKFSESSPTPIEIPSFTLTLEGGYPGMMAFAAGLDSNDSQVEGVGVLLQNGDNVIPAIKSEQGIHNFAITITGDSGHGDGKVTVKQKKAAGSAPNNSLVKFYWVEVKAVDGASFFADKAEFNGVVPAVGDEVVQMGNTKNSERQALIYITAQESGHPYIEILNGVKTKSLSGTNRTRLGDLSNIQDSAFPEGQQPSGSGLYCDNAFLRGIFLLRNGKSVEDEVNQAKQDAANATTEAERAQQTAQEAKDRLNKWADDGFISPTEKPALIDEGKRIQAEFLQIKNNADKYGVSVTEYTKAYEDYLNELRYHSAQQPEDIAVRPELAKTQTIYYDRRNGALNAIANAAKSYVDEADKKIKKYLDTEITAIPGKIELSVKTQLEKTTIGGNNLIDGSKGYWFDQSDYRGNVSLNYNPASNGWISVLGSGAFNCYKQWMNVDKTAITPGKQYTLGIDVSIGGNYIHEAGLFFNIRYYEDSTAKLVADKTINLTNDTKWTRYYVTLELPSVLPSGITVNDLFFLCGFTGNNTGAGAGLIVSYKNINLVEGGIGTSWSPSANDTYGKSVEYTTSQIDIVEKKIELKVSSTTYEEGISKAQRIARYLSTGRMLPEHSDVCFSKGLNNIKVYNNAGTEGVKIHRSSIAGVPNNTGYSCTINTNLSMGDTTPGAGGFYFGNQARYGAMFLYKLVAAIPKGRILEFTTNAIGDGSTREWLTSNVGTDKWEEYYYLIKCGTSGTLSSSGFFYIVDKANVEWHLAYATVYDVFGDNSQIDKTTYETKITQLESSISLKASQTDLNSATERIRQAEIKLDSTSIKLGVVEGTANDAKSTASSASSAASSAQSTANAANSLAGTANNKAEAADGRVTATQNGLVETGINITSRRIVLKSDNVIFQNNAGHQISAVNANGRLTANVIEAGEVVANGFAAQRITTGNLTVTDGAVIGGMTITGGVLTGKNINIQDGARIGNFTIVSGIFSSQNTPAGIQMTLSNNTATFDSSGVRVEHNSGGYALTTTGNGRVFLTGSDFWVQCKDVDFMGVQTWKAPGVFYACTILGSGAIGATWGNPDFHIKRVVLNSTGRYTVYTSGGQVGNYFVMVQGYDPSLWLSTTVEPYSPGEFTYKVFDVNTGLKNAAVIIYFCGMVS